MAYLRRGNYCQFKATISMIESRVLFEPATGVRACKHVIAFVMLWDAKKGMITL